MATPFALRNRIKPRETLIFEFTGSAAADDSDTINLSPGIWRLGVHGQTIGTDGGLSFSFNIHGNADQDVGAISGAMTVNMQASGAATILGVSLGTKSMGGSLMDISSTTGNANPIIVVPYGLYFTMAHGVATAGTWKLVVIASEV